VVEPRVAGAEVVLIYEQGVLRSADARTGPVTTSVKTILTVPLTFVPLRKETPVPDYLEVIADVYMEGEAFARLNQERKQKNLPAFSDPRAAVQDSLQQTDARVSAKRPLNYFCSGCGKRVGLPAATYYELMLALQELGLRVNRPHIRVTKGIREAVEHCRRLKKEKSDFPYPVEGALIRVNSLELQERTRQGLGNLPEKVIFRF
jgi:DNA ligase (NAD+)